MSDRHLAALQNKHQNVDNALIKEENRPFPDNSKIQSLKKQKLTLKDQMEKMLQDA